ncbi:hypothetical protein ONZ45_g18181 [Pleurotus djamor]|nr:hypothetical protein ONZ45_g18181 [Pleurotus djamor]
MFTTVQVLVNNNGCGDDSCKGGASADDQAAITRRNQDSHKCLKGLYKRAVDSFRSSPSAKKDDQLVNQAQPTKMFTTVQVIVNSNGCGDSGCKCGESCACKPGGCKC